MKFREWFQSTKEMIIKGGGILLWVSPRKWHANEMIYLIRTEKELEKILDRNTRERLLMALPAPEIIALGKPSYTLMSLIWDKDYDLRACFEYNSIIETQRADMLWEFITDKERRETNFLFIKEPNWDDALEIRTNDEANN